MAAVARRSVLQGIAAAALLPIAVGGVAAAAPRGTVGIGEVSRRVLEAAVGSSVRIVGGGASVSGTLAQVRDLRHSRPGHPHAFTAAFHVGDDAIAVLEQGLVDIVLPTVHLTGAGLYLTGGPEVGSAVLHVDRRSVSEHLTTRA